MVDKLHAENAELHRRLEEAEETIRAIQSGAVDAFVVEDGGAHRVYTLDSVDRPYRLFVEQMLQGAATMHADGTLVYCNRQLADLLGAAAEKMVGATFNDFVAAEDRVIYEDLLRQAGDRGCHGEARLRRADGALIAAYLTFSVLPKECGAAIGLLVTDLTTQRLHEQLAAAHHALRDSEERCRMLADNMAQLAWTCDQLGNVTWYNQRWLDYTGLSFEAMQGWGWKKLTHPDHVDRVVASVVRASESGGIWEDTFPLRGRDGQYRWFLSSAVPIRNERGKIARWFGTNTDVTERINMEEELKEGDRRKDEFLAVLAHELRNPLAPIRNSLHILRMTAQRDPAARRVSEMMERQVNHMVRLVDDLMEVSRITRGNIELRTEPVELAAIVRSAVETSRPLIDAAGHVLTLALPSEPLVLDGDPVRLAQVLANLLNNAAKYTEAGGQIWLSARREAETVAIAVRDTGMGITSEMLPRVFDLFTQVDRRGERGQGGLGIGLALVKSLVEMHGGSVDARSPGAGEGCEFIVRLPLSSARLPVAASGELADRSDTSLRRVLVVDDNQDAADSLGVLLKLVGADVRIAYNGAEALAAFAAYKPAVVILDIGMPDMDGLEVARRIRSEPQSHGVTLIALTGWGQEEDRHGSKGAGFDAHLVKPVDLHALTELLASRSPG